METKPLGILCAQCTRCFYYGEYPTSNGSLPRCELADVCLMLERTGLSENPCPAFRPLPGR